jgi:hypothetical protein
MFLESNPDFTVEVSVTTRGAENASSGLYQRKMPIFQRFVIENSTLKEEFLQNQDQVVEIDHELGEYVVMPQLSRMFPPLGEIIGLASQQFPFVLLPGAAAEGFGGATLGDVREEDGRRLEELVLPYTDMMGGSFVRRLWIDDLGRPARYSNERATGEVLFASEFQNYSTATLAEDLFEFRPEAGYVHAFLHPPVTVGFGERVQLPEMSNKEGETVTQADVLAEAPVALVFTDPACQVCNERAEALIDFRSAMSDLNVQVYELSFNTDQPESFTRAEGLMPKLGGWDEQSIAPSTPYFLLVDGQGTVQAVWQGVDPSDPTAAQRHFEEALQQESDN